MTASHGNASHGRVKPLRSLGNRPIGPLIGNQQVRPEGTAWFGDIGLGLLALGDAEPAPRPGAIDAAAGATSPEGGVPPPYRGERAHTDPYFGKSARPNNSRGERARVGPIQSDQGLGFGGRRHIRRASA